MSDCEPLYCMTVAERSVWPHGLLLVMLGDEERAEVLIASTNGM